MASAQKSSTSRKKTTKKRKTQNPFQIEVILIITFVVSILLILGSFNLGGTFGSVLNQFIFGVFGLLAYIVPYLLFLSIAFAISNRKNKKAIVKLISSVFLFVIITGLVQLLFYGYEKKAALLSYYKLCAEKKLGGGLLGSIISRPLCYLFGVIGAYVILLAAIALLIMLITEKFLFASLSKRKTKQKKHSSNRLTQKDEIYDEEETVSPIKRKPAKVVTIEKDPVEYAVQKDKLDEKRQKEEVHKKGKSVIPKEVEMEEFIPKEMDSAFIFQAESGLTQESLIQEDMNIEEEESAYEEEEIIIKEESKKKEQIPLQNQNRQERKRKKEVKQEQAESKIVSFSEQTEQKRTFTFPPLELLKQSKSGKQSMSDIELKKTAIKLQSTLESFGVRVTITNVSCGPSVTRYELQPEQGVKVSKITNLADDIKLNLAAADIRIEAPIPGKAAVGIEVPNKENTTVVLRELLESREFKTHSSNIAFAVGKDIAGKTVVADIAKMPHLLIAGATGSGKSVCINTLIMSILYKANPDDVKLIMIDPKVVELSAYNGIPHLLIPVVTDPKKASAALNWAVTEMTERYKKFASLSVRNIRGYNKKIATMKESERQSYEKMPQIVIIVDELADLMMVAPGEVEEAICRLAQMARAAGLHLILATQRPSVNVITGVIKANVPSRIAFSVSSAIDSRTIIDGAGAEKLLGKGDMLFFPVGYPKPIRVQGAFVSDKEVSAVVEFFTAQNGKDNYSEEVTNKIIAVQETTGVLSHSRDHYFAEAGRFIIEKEKASIGMLQRVYKIGFNRAARIMDQLCEAGVVGPEEGTKPRKVLMSMEEFEQYMEESANGGK